MNWDMISKGLKEVMKEYEDFMERYALLKDGVKSTFDAQLYSQPLMKEDICTGVKKNIVLSKTTKTAFVSEYLKKDLRTFFGSFKNGSWTDWEDKQKNKFMMFTGENIKVLLKNCNGICISDFESKPIEILYHKEAG
jgi:hypothetical protein